MASRRMFSLRIISTARFLKMPVSSQALYFHLGMHADDDGIVEAYPVIKTVGCTEDDLRVLCAKGFVQVLNEDMVSFITDWQENNKIRADRKIDSIYKDLLIQMNPDAKPLEKKPVSGRCLSNVSHLSDTCQADDGQMSVTCQTNDGIGKDRLGQDRIGKDRLGQDSNKNYSSLSVSGRILNHWNALQSLGIKPIRMISGKREESVRARIRQYGEDAFIEAIEKIRESDFLQGKNNRGWTITFDWLILPSNFPKVLEGNYDNSNHQQQDKYSQRMEDIGNWGKQFEE